MGVGDGGRWEKINGTFWHIQKIEGKKIYYIFFLVSFHSQQWSDELMKLAYNISQSNGSSTMFLRKAHVKLCLQVDKSGKIPIKKWVCSRFFIKHVSWCYSMFVEWSTREVSCIKKIFIASVIDFAINLLIPAFVHRGINDSIRQ